MGKDVITCTHLREVGSLYSCQQGIVLDSHQRTGTFYFHTFQLVTVGLHPNCAEFCTMTIFVNGLISNEGDAGEDWICFTGDDEETSLVTYASTYESRIRWMKQVNIGVCNGLTCFVNDGALVAGFRFLYAFHEDLLSFLFGTCSDADRIEAYHLLDGFGQMLVLDSCRDTKVLQFVVEEVDGVTRLLLTELSQRIREGYVIVFTRYSFLCLCTDSQQQGKNESNISVHGG